MIIDDQRATVAFLSDASTFSVSAPVETMETHISRIFLAGDRAFKMKRAVKLPYADFSTAELRLAACRKEVELNRLTAPGLYLGVRSIFRDSDGRLSFAGQGELVDAVVEMVRFDQAQLFDRMAVAGDLTPELMTSVARMIVRFHRITPVAKVDGGAAQMAAVLDVNEAGFATSHVFSPEEIAAFSRLFRDRLARHAALLDRRAAAGKVRRCHGDLHLRNICLLDGEPSLFDCIEFNDEIATVDILYDLAFLLMDLWHRGFPDLANLVMNRYLDEADDEDGFIALPFLMAVRAAVRAHVSATQAEEGGARASELAAEARAYCDLARAFLAERPARLVLVGGLSGSGKTTVASALAPKVGSPPGARIIESDRVRKAMHGVSAETRLPPAAYRPEVSAKVYQEMVWRTGLILAEGGAVVANAVYDRAVDRRMIEKPAIDHHVGVTAVWLDADPTLLWQRIDARRGGPSDATVDVLSQQLNRKPVDVDWERLDAGQPCDTLVGQILEMPARVPLDAS